MAIGIVPIGWEWVREEGWGGYSLRLSEEEERRDRERGESDDVQSLRLLREEADRMVAGLWFTVDLHSNHPDNKCPMLDVKVWKELDGGYGGVRVLVHPRCATLKGHTTGGVGWSLWVKS